MNDAELWKKINEPIRVKLKRLEDAKKLVGRKSSRVEARLTKKR